MKETDLFLSYHKRIVNKDMKRKCHNYQPACDNKDCNACEDWWYSEADTGRFAEKGR
jgi:hypothetical protein